MDKDSIQEREAYEPIELEVIEFDSEDVITTSVTGEQGQGQTP